MTNNNLFKSTYKRYYPTFTKQDVKFFSVILTKINKPSPCLNIFHILKVLEENSYH